MSTAFIFISINIYNDPESTGERPAGLEGRWAGQTSFWKPFPPQRPVYCTCSTYDAEDPSLVQCCRTPLIEAFVIPLDTKD